MSHLKLKVGCHEYDRTRALFDGTVKLDGVEARFDGAGLVSDIFERMVRQCVLNRAPRVARLFPNYESVEREYYQRTGIFPIMHTVVIRKDMLARHPGLAQVLYRGFCEAKEVAMEGYRKNMMEHSMDTMIPWFNPLLDENSRLFPKDWWPYGVEANRKTLDTFLRYFFEQGLSKRRLTCEDLFVPELLTT